MIFLGEAIKSMRTTGAVASSSQFLVKKMIKPISFEDCNTIVEFGAGTGVITKAILKQVNSDTNILAFETNKNFYNELNEINDKRLTVYNQSVENFKSILLKENITEVDYIVSSLPLAIFNKETVETILKMAMLSLKTGGKYIQFQYSTKSLKILKEYLTVNLDFSLINIPPAFVYIGTKR
jgi:phosphatidylethanolamine/phosphatidyl-N-methylethanolamine N-methyltransferase